MGTRVGVDTEEGTVPALGAYGLVGMALDLRSAERAGEGKGSQLPCTNRGPSSSSSGREGGRPKARASCAGDTPEASLSFSSLLGALSSSGPSCFQGKFFFSEQLSLLLLSVREMCTHIQESSRGETENQEEAPALFARIKPALGRGGVGWGG